MMNWQLSNITDSLESSLSLSPTQPDTQSTKYWLSQILCLSLVLGWQSKQLDCHSTVFHPDSSSPPTSRPLSARTPTVLLSPCGGPSALQSAPCRSSSRVTSSYSPTEQDRTCQCNGNTCWWLGVSDFCFGLNHLVSEWPKRQKIMITVRKHVGFRLPTDDWLMF